MARLLEKYQKEVAPQMVQKFSYRNRLQVPRLEKIVVNMGVGEATEDQKHLEAAARDLTLITGQKPLVTKAKKSVSAFKLREGMPVGCKVTLRRKRMYEFLDRLISVVLPRIRDFRGLNPNSFDAQGNYSVGISDQLVFPEVNVDKVETTQGLDVTICVRGGTVEESRELLRLLGLPFRRT